MGACPPTNTRSLFGRASGVACCGGSVLATPRSTVEALGPLRAPSPAHAQVKTSGSTQSTFLFPFTKHGFATRSELATIIPCERVVERQLPHLRDAGPLGRRDNWNRKAPDGGGATDVRCLISRRPVGLDHRPKTAGKRHHCVATRISIFSVRCNACDPPGTFTVRAPDEVKSPVRAPIPSGPRMSKRTCPLTNRWPTPSADMPSSRKPRTSSVRQTLAVPSLTTRAFTRISASLLALGCLRPILHPCRATRSAPISVNIDFYMKRV